MQRFYALSEVAHLGFVRSLITFSIMRLQVPGEMPCPDRLHYNCRKYRMFRYPYDTHAVTFRQIIQIFSTVIDCYRISCLQNQVLCPKFMFPKNFTVACMANTLAWKTLQWFGSFMDSLIPNYAECVPPSIAPFSAGLLIKTSMESNPKENRSILPEFSLRNKPFILV